MRSVGGKARSLEYGYDPYNLHDFWSRLTLLQAMENRAVKHAARREDVLVRAIMRIWKAHERGKLLTRVRSLRILKQTWSLWKRRMEEQREREGWSFNIQTIDDLD